MTSVGQKIERKVTYRYVLDSPYTVHWEQAEAGAADEIYGLIVEFLEAAKLKGMKYTAETHSKYLVCGMNSINASAEAREQCCMVACIPNYQSRTMFEHFPTLAKVTDTKLLTLSMSPTKLGKLFSCRSVLALGFTKACLQHEEFAPVLAKLMDETKPYCFVAAPWYADTVMKSGVGMNPLQSIAYKRTVPNNSRVTIEKAGKVVQNQPRRPDPTTFQPKKKLKKAKTPVNK